MANFPIFTPPPPSPFFNLPKQPDYSGGIAAGIGGIGESFRANRAEDFAAQTAADLQAYRNASLDQKQSELDLTRADVGVKALKEGYRLNPQTNALEPIPGYTPAPDAPKITAITSIRKEYLDQPGVSSYNKSVAKVKDMIDQLDSTGAVSDMSFIYAMAQIYDPNSTVREGELQMAQGSQSLIDELTGKFAKAARGEPSLSRDVRAQFIRAANGRLAEYAKQAEEEAKYYRGVAERNGIDPADIVRPIGAAPDLSTLPPLAAAIPTAPAPPVPLPPGTPPLPPGATLE